MWPRFLRRYATLAALVVAAWIVFAFLIAPAFIRQGYAGQSLEIVNGIFFGREVHDVQYYLGIWRRLALMLSVGVGLALAVLFLWLRFPDARRALMENVIGGEGPLSAPGVIAIGALLGVAGGLLESAKIAYGILVNDGVVPFVFQSGVEAIWMAPFMGLVLALLLSVPLVAVGALIPKLRRPRPVIFVLSVWMLAGLAARFPELGFYARLLLVLGLSMQAASLGTRFWIGKRSRVHRWAWAMAIMALLLPPVIEGVKVVQARRAKAALPAAPTGAPNVLLLILDTVRARSMSLYGYLRPTTPALERLADSSLVFDQAMSTTSWTLPAHASIFTGLAPHETSADFFRPLDASHVSLAEYLRDRGYATGGFVANLGYGGVHWGLARGFTHYEDYRVSLREALRASAVLSWLSSRPAFRQLVGYHEPLSHKSAAQTNRELLDWLDRDPGRPFFAFVNYFDAHGPRLVPDQYMRRFRQDPTGMDERLRRQSMRTNGLFSWVPKPRAKSDERVLRADIDAYDAAIAYLDDQIERLLHELDRRGLLDNTIVVLTSDHGEEFYEHRQYGHARSVYAETIHVPLLVHWPGRLPEGERITSPVGLSSLPISLAHWLTPWLGENPAPFPGRPWPRNASDTASVPPMVFAELRQEGDRVPDNPQRRWFRSALQGRWKYVRNPNDTEELYDLAADPDEQHNLMSAGLDRHAEAALMADSLRRAVERFNYAVVLSASNEESSGRRPLQ